MRIKHSFLISILVTLFLFFVVSLALFAQGKPLREQASSESDVILIDGAKATWKADITLAGELDAALATTLPRLVIEQAATIWDAELQGSQGLLIAAGKMSPRLLIEQAAITAILGLSPSEPLTEKARKTLPRILIEHAATTTLIQGLQGSSTLLEATNEMSPKILIEHAETMQCYRLLPFRSSSPPARKPVLVWWIMVGALAVVALIVVLTRSI